MTVENTRTVLLTGAAGGLGRAFARALVASGRRVILVDRNKERLDELATELGSAAYPIVLDISDAAAVDALPSKIPAAFQPVDVLFNNAGHDIGGRTAFAEGSPDPVTQAFVAAYGKKFNKLPSLYGFSMYSGAMWVDEALKTIKGNAEDRDAFLASVSKTDLTGSPLGQTVKMDSYGNPIYDVHIRKVVKNKDGKYWNAPIANYPNVSQFWKYDPVTYMKQPPYSREFQGIKKA